MQIDINQEVRTIHPKVLQELPMEVITELLQVANDLRTGVIPPEHFIMSNFNTTLRNSEGEDCGTAHCIAGWVAFRLKTHHRKLFYNGENGPADFGPGGHEPPLRKLFYNRPSDPVMAADAVEAYVYDYDDDPWRAAGYAGPSFYQW